MDLNPLDDKMTPQAQPALTDLQIGAVAKRVYDEADQAQSYDEHAQGKKAGVEALEQALYAAIANAPIECAAPDERADSGALIARAALERIERWFGEFPVTGDTWQDGTPVSYGGAYGSNGERDYMRGVARDALASMALVQATLAAQPAKAEADAVQNAVARAIENGEDPYLAGITAKATPAPAMPAKAEAK